MVRVWGVFGVGVDEGAHEISAIRTVAISEGQEWGLDPSWLDFAFLGRPGFQSRGPKILILKGFGTSGRKIGAPENREIQPRRIEPPSLGPPRISVAISTLFPADLETILVSISLVLCDFTRAATTTCLGLSGSASPYPLQNGAMGNMTIWRLHLQPKGVMLELPGGSTQQCTVTHT